MEHDKFETNFPIVGSLSIPTESTPKNACGGFPAEILLSQLDRLYRFAYNRLHDEYAAEDLTQDIVEAALRSRHCPDDPERIVPWLWGIARNVYLRTVSAKSRNEIPTEDVAVITDPFGTTVTWETPETALIRREDAANLRRAVSYLSKMYRDVCVAYWLEEKDYKTIAEELDIPLSSVKWRLNQSKVRLKEELMKMETMTNGYHRAQKLHLNMGGWVVHSGELGNYDGADKATETLLAQNICIAAYDAAKTVTELASELGCAADYIEDALTSLVETRCITQTKDRYRTNFPIWDEAACREIFTDGFNLCMESADKILDALLAVGEDVKNVGFTGADRPFEKLLLLAMELVAQQLPNDRFDADNLPFISLIDGGRKWYVLGTLADPNVFYVAQSFGRNSSSFHIGGELSEYTFETEFTKDTRTYNHEMIGQFYDFYTTGKLPDEYNLAKLLENGKLRKTEEGYEIAVPMISSERGEYAKLAEALEPVRTIVADLQNRLCARSADLMKKHIPAHLADQRKFFESYCAHGAWENAVYTRMVARGIPITQDMACCLIVK